LVGGVGERAGKGHEKRGPENASKMLFPINLFNRLYAKKYVDERADREKKTWYKYECSRFVVDQQSSL
jgi:hypothetical protein